MQLESFQGQSAPDSSDILLVEDRDGVRSLSLNRPHKLNALNTELSEALYSALGEADRDPSVRALVLSGNGRAFCAGGDLSEFKHAGIDDREVVEHRSTLISRTHERLQSLSKPIVAAAHGAAFGGGAGLALACDMVVAGQNIQIAYPEFRNGIVPAIVMPGLQRHLGRKMAFEMATLGTVMTAEDLLGAGLVNRVVESDKVVAEAFEIASIWAACDTEVMAITKSLLYRVADLPFAEAMAAGRDINRAVHTLNLAQNEGATGAS